MGSRVGVLKITPYKDIKELEDFYCGVAEMDNFIHHSDGFTLSINNHYCKAFIVRDSSDEVIAVFALNFDAVQFDEDNLDDMFSGVLSSTPDISYEYRDVFMSKSHHPALEITYLAVKKGRRTKGIGKVIVDKIASAAQKQILAGCEFLTVSAYHNKEYSAVGFYSKCQFNTLDIRHDSHNTTRMFRMLYPKEGE